jgi:hypothetical protein
MGRDMEQDRARHWAPFVGGLAFPPTHLSTVFGGNVVFRGGRLQPLFPFSLSLFVFCKKRGLPKCGGGDSCPNKRTATDKPETHLLFLSVKRRGRGDLPGKSEKIKPEYKSTVCVGVATPGQGKIRPPCAVVCVVP